MAGNGEYCLTKSTAPKDIGKPSERWRGTDSGESEPNTARASYSRHVLHGRAKQTLWSEPRRQKKLCSTWRPGK